MYSTLKYVRGSIWFLNMTAPNSVRDESNSVQSGRRPILIISNDTGNRFSPTITVVPLTASAKNNQPTHYHFKIDSTLNTALCEQVSTIAKSNLGYYVGHLPKEAMLELDECVLIALGIKTMSTIPEEKEEEQKEKTHSTKARTTAEIIEFCEFLEQNSILAAAKKYNLGFASVSAAYRKYCKKIGRTKKPLKN